jgi:hypothetical protein
MSVLKAQIHVPTLKKKSFEYINKNKAFEKLSQYTTQRALVCKYASTQATFFMVLHFFVFASFHGYSSMIEYLFTKLK